MINEFLNLYNDELRALRHQGEEFAKAYPKVASRLRLGSGGVEDPMVGRLLESFAFLTARLGFKLNKNTEFITEVLIHLLYPHYALPIPAFSTIKFHPKVQLETSYSVPAGTQIAAETPEGHPCFFTTCYPVTLWPIELSNIRYQRQSHVKSKNFTPNQLRSCLIVNLKATKSYRSLASIKPSHLRFFIRAESHQANLLYELLFNRLKEIAINFEKSNGKTVLLPVDCIKTVGFAGCDAILPFPAHGFSGYRLLSEYFAYPEKFLYFDVNGLDQYLHEGMASEIELHFFFDQVYVSLEKIIDVDSLAFGCAPIVNLFDQVSEPIKIDQKTSEYHLIPDAHRPQESIEIYQVKSVDISSDTHVGKMSSFPYFGRKHNTSKTDYQLYWYTERKSCWEVGAHHVPGYEWFISFSELGGPENLHDHVIVTPKLLCTNRDLAQQLPAGGGGPNFFFWQSNHEMVESIQPVKPITPSFYRECSKTKLIDLVSHLFTQQLSFDCDDEALDVLKKSLVPYGRQNEYDNTLIQLGLISVETKKVAERHPINIRQGFCLGIQYTLTIDEKHFTDNNAYLFGSVLSEFLSISCSVNSFVKFILKDNQQGEIARWKAKLGVKRTC